MSLIATALKHMLASGMAHDAIVAAIEEMEACLPTERPRSSAADRMARMRERNKASQSVTNVTERNEDEAKKEIPPTPPKEKNINIYTPESSNELSAPKRSRRKPETPLPMDFPTAEQITDAETRANAAGVDIKIKFQAERFRNHAETTDRRCRDWGAAWRNWVSMAIDRAGGRPAGEKPPEAVPRSDLIRAYRHSGTWLPDWGEKPTPAELAA